MMHSNTISSVTRFQQWSIYVRGRTPEYLMIPHGSRCVDILKPAFLVVSAGGWKTLVENDP